MRGLETRELPSLIRDGKPSPMNEKDFYARLVALFSEKKYRPGDFKDMLVSLAVTALVVLPWQIFTIIKYPAETHMAHAYNVQHLYRPIEGHRGSILYHFQHFNELYGSFTMLQSL